MKKSIIAPVVFALAGVALSGAQSAHAVPRLQYESITTIVKTSDWVRAISLEDQGYTCTHVHPNANRPKDVIHTCTKTVYRYFALTHAPALKSIQPPPKPKPLAHPVTKHFVAPR